jgi:hypothetical protein
VTERYHAQDFVSIEIVTTTNTKLLFLKKGWGSEIQQGHLLRPCHRVYFERLVLNLELDLEIDGHRSRHYLRQALRRYGQTSSCMPFLVRCHYRDYRHL